MLLYIGSYSNSSSHLNRTKNTIYVEANVINMYAKYQLHTLYYTPGIYAEGYIVFVFPFVRSYVRSFVRLFVRTSFRRVEFASKF